MSELILDTKTLPSPLHTMIKSPAVKISNFSGEIRLIPVSNSPHVDRFNRIKHAATETERKMEQLHELCGSCADLELTVDSFLTMTHDESEDI